MAEDRVVGSSSSSDDALSRTAEYVGGTLGSAARVVSNTAGAAVDTVSGVADSAAAAAQAPKPARGGRSGRIRLILVHCIKNT